jgi:hypothetical protein
MSALDRQALRWELGYSSSSLGDPLEHRRAPAQDGLVTGRVSDSTKGVLSSKIPR